MTENVPLLTHKHGDLTVEGYSRAAVQSYWRIPELKLGFDLGAHPWEFMGTPTWMISHAHLDHVAGIPLHVSRRRLMKMAPPRLLMPAYMTKTVRRMLDSFESLDRGKMPCELIGLTAGDEFELSRELVVKTLRTTHTVTSMGYVIFERRNKLKAEFRDLSGEQIRDLRESGTEITEEIRVPIIGYTGDTSPRGLDDNPLFYEVKILITEMTFVAPDHRQDLIHKNGHMHLNDFVDRKDNFKNELIVASHLSTRYSKRQAIHHVQKLLPDMLDGRLNLWI
jgi:ribonuclease Z